MLYTVIDSMHHVRASGIPCSNGILKCAGRVNGRVNDVRVGYAILRAPRISEFGVAGNTHLVSARREAYCRVGIG